MGSTDSFVAAPFAIDLVADGHILACTPMEHGKVIAFADRTFSKHILVEEKVPFEIMVRYSSSYIHPREKANRDTNHTWLVATVRIAMNGINQTPVTRFVIPYIEDEPEYYRVVLLNFDGFVTWEDSTRCCRDSSEIKLGLPHTPECLQYRQALSSRQPTQPHYDIFVTIHQAKHAEMSSHCDRLVSVFQLRCVTGNEFQKFTDDPAIVRSIQAQRKHRSSRPITNAATDGNHDDCVSEHDRGLTNRTGSTSTQCTQTTSSS